ncbi:MAG: hypothetical protein IJ963_01305 [Phascolarctobacterium sp.]|nr:hypothetical protein [Phascolarctobacterium sp.]
MGTIIASEVIATKKPNREALWKPVLPNKWGVKYRFYQKVSCKDLEENYKRFQSNPENKDKGFVKSYGPYYANLVLYVLIENMELQLTKKSDFEAIKMTQGAIGARIKELFGEYGYNGAQSNVAKALKELETPFCYDGYNNTVYTVVSAKVKDVRERGERYSYWIENFKYEYDSRALLLRSKYVSKVALPFAYVINEKFMKSGNESGWVPTGFVYRFKDAKDTKGFKDSLLKIFGEQCFFNIVIYEDNVIILLAQDYPKLRELAKVLSNLFLNDVLQENG